MRKRLWSDPELSGALDTLSEAEFDANLSYQVIGQIDTPACPGSLRKELGRLVKTDCELGRCGPRTRIVALVGPPGSGKTSALLKLAVRFGVIAHRSCQILSLDADRIAADRLCSYARIFGVGCKVLETTALARALGQHRDKDLILIDTPGLSARETGSCAELARFLAAFPGMDVHLVLSACMRAADLRWIAGRFAIFNPSKLLFTRLDKTKAFGPVLSLSIGLGRPLSFFSWGPRIPDDLKPATPGLVLDLVLNPKPARQSRFEMVAA